MVAAFMGTAGAAAPPTNQGASGATGQEDNLQGTPAAGQKKRQLLGGLLGGLGGGAGGAGGAAGGAGGAGGLLGGLGGGAAGGAGGGAGATGIAGLLGGGGQKAEGPPETRVAAAAGQGASSGMPTANADGTVDMTFRQVSHTSPIDLRV